MFSNRFTVCVSSLLVLLFAMVCLPVEAQQAPNLVWTVPSTTYIGYQSFSKDATGIWGGNADDAAGAGLASSVNYPTGWDIDWGELFTYGGTIELIVAKENDIDWHDLVISEIMWGYDSGVTDTTDRQWVEFSNVSGRDLGGFNLYVQYIPPRKLGEIPLFSDETANYIKVESTDPEDIPGIAQAMAESTRVKKDEAWTHKVVDRVSNAERSPFGNITGVFQMPGQSGFTGTVTTTSGPQVPLISAQRKGAYPGGTVAEGHKADSWVATDANARRNTTTHLLQANPGVSGTAAGIPVAGAATAAPPANMLVINEVRNHSNDELDWVEVKNIQSPAATNPDIQLNDWELSYTVEADKEVELVDFPKYVLPAQGILLIVNRDPSETELAGGVNLKVMIDTDAEQLQKGATHLYIVEPNLKLPNENKDYLLLLRNKTDKNKTHEHIQDAAGSKEIDYDFKGDRTKETKVWPFHAYGSMGGDKVVDFGRDGDNTKAWARIAKGRKAGDYGIENANGRHKGAWAAVTSADTGGVGYDRGVRKAVDLRFTPGTPGYENMIANTVDDFVSTDPDPDGMEIDKSNISISEVMYDAGPRWNLVQWIELYNQSMTQTVDIAGWELEIRNASDDVQSYVDSVFTFVDDGNTVIPPNQTLLIVSASGNSENIAPNRVYNLFEHHRRQLGLETRRSVLLSPTGFYLKLTDRADLDRDSRADKDVIVDEAGNVLVEGAKRTVQWDLPAAPSADGFRRSLVRQYGARYTPRGGNDPNNIRFQPEGGELANVGNPTVAEVSASTNGWMDFWRASDLAGAGISFYGHEDDYSTPGYRTGGPLPVSLSSFRPARDKATGEVVVRWITQSELNNAGFNILRSETKTGQFKVVNVKGIIPGHGTTSEQHVYEWKDTTAKPNVVYYYQIEDVSLDGKRTMLTTTRLKGHVSAAGKLTTTWSDLKQRD